MKTINWLKQNSLAVLLVGGFLAYAGFVGATGKCPMCAVLEKIAPRAAVERPETSPPSSAPKLNLTLVDGTQLRAEELAGKVVLVDFWATWCPPCREMIPILVELQTAYRERGFVVVGLSADQGDTNVVRSFMQKEGINYPVAMADATTAQAFGDIKYLPTSFLIDRAGRMVSRHVGCTTKAELEAEIKPLLEQ